MVSKNSKKMNDTPSIMSIRELIDQAFGEPDVNAVHHKLIYTILTLLARQLKLLQRRVKIELPPSYLTYASSSSLSITEVKLHANVPKKSKSKGPDAGALATGPKTVSYKEGTGRGGGSGHGGAVAGATKARSGMQQGTVTTSSAYDDKSSSSLTNSTTDKSSSDKTSSDNTSSAKTSSDKTSKEKSSFGKTSTNKTSSERTTIEKSPSDKPSEPSFIDKKSTEKSSTDRTLTEKSLTDKKSSISTKRTDSREAVDKPPTSTTSKPPMERQYEKLLIVERVPSDGTEASENRSQAGSREKKTPLSVVNQEEFVKLAAVVRQLHKKYETKTVPGAPDNTQLMKDFHKGAVMSDPVLALQLSARLEAVEKAMEKMLAVIIEIMNSIYIDGKGSKGHFADLIKKMKDGGSMEEILENSEDILKEIVRISTLKEVASKAAIKEVEIKSAFKEAASQAAIKEAESKSALKAAKSKKTIASKPSLRESVTETQLPAPEAEPPGPEEVKEKDYITYEDLDNALQELYDQCLKMVNTSTTSSGNHSNKALKMSVLLERRLDEALDLGDRMYNLEKLVSDYAEKINILDTSLTSQMTYYQEELTHMQHNLDSGLEDMTEAIANVGADTAAVAELNDQFTNLQFDCDVAAMRQKELQNMQNALSLDLQELGKKIQILKVDKSDRDEVADALSAKAGLGALNGLVSLQEFDAVRGDFEKRIGSAYDKFNNQEIIWQKAIDELIRELDEKADWLQLLSLQGSIDKYLDNYGARIRTMEEIVGEPRTATASNKLHREVDCLSCATPANLNLEEYNTGASSPEFPPSRPPGVGVAKPKEDGDHAGICYPGLPVPHEVDPRAHVCNRYCGGSHTVIKSTLIRAPVGMTINPALRQVNSAVGTDGRLYVVDKDYAKKPCIPCNYKKTTTPEPSEADPAPNPEDLASDMASDDVQQPSTQAPRASDDVSVTQETPPIDDDT